MIVGIALDRDNVLREVKFFSRNFGCNCFVLGDLYIRIECVDVMELNRTKADLIKIDVAIKMPRRLVRSVVIDSTRSRLQSSWLAFHRPFNIFQIDVIDAIQIDIARIFKSGNGLVVVVARRVVFLRTSSRIGYAFNPNTSDGEPAIVIDRQL